MKNIPSNCTCVRNESGHIVFRKDDCPVHSHKELPKWGGHLKGKTGPHSQGSGPVFVLRQALGVPQSQLATLAGCGVATIRRAEAQGRWPRQRKIQSNLRGIAHERDIDLGPCPDDGGVFL